MASIRVPRGRCVTMAEAGAGRERIKRVSDNSLEHPTEPSVADLESSGTDGMAAVAQALAPDEGSGDSGSDPERPPAGVDDLCRLNICGPTRSVELAIPVHVPLIDLLPAMVGHLGGNLADAGLEHGGWVLQRLGDPPLSEELSVAALGLHDGDTVHLRPRADQLPPLDFDDLIDGIAVGISGRSDRWRPETSKRLLTGLLALSLAAALALLAGRPSALADILAAATAVVLLVLAAVASRAFTDLSAAGVLAAGAIGYAAVAAAELILLPTLAGRGTVLPGLAGHGAVPAASARHRTGLPGPAVHGTAPHLAGNAVALALNWGMLRPALLAAGAAAVAMSVAATGALGRRQPVLAGTAVASVWITLAAGFAVAGRLTAAATGGITLAMLLPFSGWIPVLSFRLAGLRLDPLPTTPDELQVDLDPLPGQYLVERTRHADRYQNALYGGLAVVATGCLVLVGVAPGWPAHLVALDAATAMLLHARVLISARQRLALILPSTVGLAVLSVAVGLDASGKIWPGIFTGLVLAGGALFLAERASPGRKSLPHWGWAGDMLQSLTALALIPLVLWVLNLYHYARAVHV
jgi:type VII secretion integral membrane protein EccD